MSVQWPMVECGPRHSGGTMKSTHPAIAWAAAVAVMLLATSGTAQARTVEMATGIAFEVPDSFSISTLGGCDTQPASMASTSGAPLPLRASGQVQLKDATGYMIDVAFLTANFSNLSRVDSTLTLCLPGDVELAEPFRIDIVYFGALCVGARCPGQNLPVNVIRIAPTAPSQPTAVTATAVPGGARVSWASPTNTGGTPVTGYTVTSSPSALTCVTASLSCTVSSLDKGVPYTFTVTATNAAGTSDPSAASPEVTLTSAPGRVTAVKATALRSAIRVTWAAPQDTGGLPIARYEYRVGTQSWSSTGSRVVTLRNLTKGRAVAVQVRAVNTIGPGPAVRVRAVPR